jgi:hypothetical protein
VAASEQQKRSDLGQLNVAETEAIDRRGLGELLVQRDRGFEVSYENTGHDAGNVWTCSGQPRCSCVACHMRHERCPVTPAANCAARPGYSPGTTSAEPGWPGPWRPSIAPIAASAPVVPSLAASAAARARSPETCRHSAMTSSRSNSSGGGSSGSGSQLLAGRLVLVSEGVQPGLPVRLGHPVRPGNDRLPLWRLVWPGINRLTGPRAGSSPCPGSGGTGSWCMHHRPFGILILNLTFHDL